MDRLFACNRVSGEIWNNCLAIAGEHHKETGKWISKTELQRAIKRKFPLHSQSIQAVAHKYLEAREGARQAQAKGYPTRYPYKKKMNFVTKWAKDGFQVGTDGKIELSMGVWKGKRQKPIVVSVKEIPQGKIKEIELVWDNGLYLAISYEKEEDNKVEELTKRLKCWKSQIEENPKLAREEGVVALIIKTEDALERARARALAREEKAKGDSGQVRPVKLGAIDMGEIHAIAAVEEAGEGIIITGRQLRSNKRLRNKKYKEIAKKQARAKKGSRRWKKLQRAKRKINSKIDAQQTDILHKISRQFVDWAEENRLTTVVVGDVEGVQRNTSAKNKSNPKKKRRSRKVSQKLSQWSFGVLLTYLAYKLAYAGIELIKFPEEYTSQTCPVCNRRKKVSGRVYRCHCGYSQHRDIHGALNILAKYKHGKICDTGIKIGNTKYLRPIAMAVESSRRPEPGLWESGHRHSSVPQIVGSAKGS